MGSSPYFYFVKYEDDLNSALIKLREREFNAGRYNPVIDFPEFPINESNCPGKKHKTIQEAMEAAEEDGTRSILDIEKVSEENDFCIARILKKEEMIKYFGTETPTKEIVENKFDFFEDIERGKAFCIKIYNSEQQPVELYFVGYSFD